MICANCHTERAKGSHYCFHYGFVIQEKNKAEKVVTGSDQVWICRICVTRRFILTWIVGALLFLGLILKLQDDYLISQIQFFITPRIRQVFGVDIGFPLARFAYDAIPVIMIVWAIGGIFGAYLLWQGIKEIGAVGENLAIKILKDQYSQFNLFLTSRQYQKKIVTGESDLADLITTADIEGLLTKKDVDRLIEVLERGGTRALQMEAADALGRLRDKKAIAPLVKIINNRYWAIGVRVSSVESLGRIGGQEALKALNEYAVYKDLHQKSEDVVAIR